MIFRKISADIGNIDYAIIYMFIYLETADL